MQACCCGGEMLEGLWRWFSAVFWLGSKNSFSVVSQHNRCFQHLLIPFGTFSPFYNDADLNSAKDSSWNTWHTAWPYSSTLIKRNWILSHKIYILFAISSYFDGVKAWIPSVYWHHPSGVCFYPPHYIIQRNKESSVCSAPLIYVWDVKMHINSLNWSRPNL